MMFRVIFFVTAIATLMVAGNAVRSGTPAGAPTAAPANVHVSTGDAANP